MLRLSIYASFIHAFFLSDETGIYTISVQAINNVGNRGEIAVLHNVLIGRNLSITTRTSKSTVQHANTTAHTYKSTKRMNPTGISISSIAGGSTGAFVFLCLAVFIFLFLLRKIRKKQRDQAIRVKYSFSSHSIVLVSGIFSY